MDASEYQVGQVYYFSASNGHNANGWNEEKPQPPVRVLAVTDSLILWDDGVRTYAHTVMGRLAKTPEQAMANTRAMIHSQCFH